MQTDPVGYGDQFNLYTYVANDPLNGTDPSGEEREENKISFLEMVFGGEQHTQTQEFAGRDASGALEDASASSDFIDHNVEAPIDALNAIGDFESDRQDMVEANTIGADKFFCKANCEAAQRGPGGERAAEVLSDVRELTDTMRKGPNPADTAADQIANQVGRDFGRQYPNESCSAGCAEFIPNGLPEKYVDD